MNWGYGIAIVYGLFVVLMLGAVVASTQHDPGLISKDYYDLDINYQEHFDKKQNTANLESMPVVRYDLSSKEIVVHFPEGMPVSKGNIQFRRTTTTDDDFLFNMPAVPSGKPLRIPAGDLPDGRWLMDIDWNSQGKGYFYATAVAVQPV